MRLDAASRHIDNAAWLLCWHGPSADAIEQEAWEKYRIEIINDVLDKTHGNCAYCGRDVMNTVNVDHVMPKCQGGSDLIGNLVASCRSCNSSKGPSGIEEWRYFKRSKLASALDGMPTFSRGQVSWLYKNGFDVFAGLPEYKFWFEREGISGIEGVKGEVGEWLDTDRIREAYQAIVAHRAAMFETSCKLAAEEMGIPVHRVMESAEKRAFQTGKYTGAPVWGATLETAQ